MEWRQAAPFAQRLPYLCPSCTLRAQLRRPRVPSLHRQFRLRFFQSEKSRALLVSEELQSQLVWSRKAAEIRAGRKESMLSTLDKRGFINQIVGERADLDRLLTEKSVGVYVGVDPTAPSLHVGHLVPFMALYWMYCHGFPAFSVLGGATAKIGDPSGRKAARAAQSDSEQTHNADMIRQQLEALWSGTEIELARNGLKNDGLDYRRELVNNTSWLKDAPMMEMMRLLLPGVRVGTMLGRETVRTRLNSKEGMSVAEFLYPVIQAWDFWHLYSTKGVQIQIGGSDQFGNILAGMDAINHIRKNHYDPEFRDDGSQTDAEKTLQKKPMGFTIPLLTTVSGQKFGKSAGNAIWLDPEMTSPFDLYQFFLGTADTDVHRYLKLFTFESLESLNQLMEDHAVLPSKRLAQHVLALNVLRLVHGNHVAEKTRDDHSRLFQSRFGYTTASIRSIAKQHRSEHASEHTVRDLENSSTNVTLPVSLVYGKSLAQVLFHAGLVGSRSEGQRLYAANGVYIGVKPGVTESLKWMSAKDLDPRDAGNHLIDGDLLFLRAGKTKIRVVMITSDADFEARGLTAPGWTKGQEYEKEAEEEETAT